MQPIRSSAFQAEHSTAQPQAISIRYTPSTMEDLNEEDRANLISDIATRAGTTKELCLWYDIGKAELQTFVDSNRVAIELAKQEHQESAFPDQVSPAQLGDLWISNKFERLQRLQFVADLAYDAIQAGAFGDSTLLREFRSYLTLAANELGQLLHRGAGDAADGDVVTYEFKGIDLDNLK